MKKNALFISTLALMIAACGSMVAKDITDEIPTIELNQEGFKHIPDVAQYGGGDWSGVVGIAHGITRSEALKIARQDPNITFFFYTKGGQMVLCSGDDYRVFRHGDTVFFTGEPQWGTAPGLADGYMKE